MPCTGSLWIKYATTCEASSARLEGWWIGREGGVKADGDGGKGCSSVELQVWK